MKEAKEENLPPQNIIAPPHVNQRERWWPPKPVFEDPPLYRQVMPPRVQLDSLYGETTPVEPQQRELKFSRVCAEIVYGAEECYQHSIDLLEELGFPKAVLPLQCLVECGRVRETGFVWMKQKMPYEHFFVGLNTRVSYATEVTAYVNKFTMKKITGIKSKKMFLWVPISEMIMEGQAASKNITFKTPMGIGRSFPVTAFMT